MKYLCLAYGDPAKMAALTKEEFDALLVRCRAFDEELRATGCLVSATSLEWGSTCIRLQDGKPVVTDGPYLETKEQVGGLIVLEARDLNEALRVAALHPAARIGAELGWGLEIRPVADGCHQ